VGRDRALPIFQEIDSFDYVAEVVGCHPSTVRRWERRVLPYRMGGGMERRTLTCEDRLLLSKCICIYPDAIVDDLSVFIYANGGKVYNRVDITRRCQEPGLSRK